MVVLGSCLPAFCSVVIKYNDNFRSECLRVSQEDENIEYDTQALTSGDNRVSL